MEYRSTTPVENGFDDEDEQHDTIRHYIQSVMRKSGPGELLDNVLIVANICEQRAIFNGDDPKMKKWYETTATFLRGALELLARHKNERCPLDLLEDQSLYFPDMEILH